MDEARRPNELLRRARVLRGWLQQRVADHINQLLGAARADRELVYRWESGKRTPSPFYRERLCQVFAMTAEELGLVELVVPKYPGVAGTLASEWAGGTPDVAAGSPLLESVNKLVRELWGDEVNRRAVLQFLGALAAGTALEEASLKRTSVVPLNASWEFMPHG
jgi:transcriptional regulator with XRE-family HTH domain